MLFNKKKRISKAYVDCVSVCIGAIESTNVIEIVPSFGTSTTVSMKKENESHRDRSKYWDFNRCLYDETNAEGKLTSGPPRLLQMIIVRAFLNKFDGKVTIFEFGFIHWRWLCFYCTLLTKQYLYTIRKPRRCFPWCFFNSLYDALKNPNFWIFLLFSNKCLENFPEVDKFYPLTKHRHSS